MLQFVPIRMHFREIRMMTKVTLVLPNQVTTTSVAGVCVK